MVLASTTYQPRTPPSKAISLTNLALSYPLSPIEQYSSPPLPNPTSFVPTRPSSPPKPTSTHMITQLQIEHLKPHQIMDLSHILQSHHEPTSYKTTLQQPHRHNAMIEEFNTLISQN